MTIIEQLKDADYTLAADGYKDFSYVRLAISEAIRALSPPLVGGSYTSGDIIAAWARCTENRGFGYVLTLQDLLSELSNYSNVSIKTEKINMKNFKDNQKVRHPKYGEGVINIDRWENNYVVTFNEVNRVTSPIGDDFYNQLEPVEDLPEVGEYAYFWTDEMQYNIYGEYKGKSNCGRYIVKITNTITDVFKNISKNPPKFD